MKLYKDYICPFCKGIFTREICKEYANPKYCSKLCKTNSKKNKKKCLCTQCLNPIEVPQRDVKKSKSGNNFCSKSCSATWNNKNKIYGIRRSKLEIYIEEQLKILYPNIEIHFNQKDTIKSELDIYIPFLKLAFEINGIFHSKPIYGEEKFQKIKINDQLKIESCFLQEIDLNHIDVSTYGSFNPKTALKYFNIINNILIKKLLISSFIIY